MIDGIREYIESKKYDFKIIKIKYSKEEQNVLDKLVITSSGTYNYYGSIKRCDGISSFLAKVCSNNKEVQDIINKIIINVLSEFNTKYFWISIRVTMPTTIYDIPRWHKDGRFFIESDKETPKFATVLKGPGTLLIKHSAKIDKMYKEIQNEARKEMRDVKQGSINVQNKYRYIYAKKFEKIKIIQTKNDEGVVFYPVISDQSIGAIHSEPKIDIPRLFLSILPGSKENINNLKERFNNNTK